MKIILSTGVSALVGVLLILACNRSPVVADKQGGVVHPPANFEEYVAQRFAGTMAVNVGDPGQLHNDLLAQFDQRRSLDDASVLPREDLAHIYADAANAVMDARGYSQRFTSTDISVFMWYLDQFEDVFDFHGEEVSNPMALIEHMRANGNIDDEEAQDLQNMVRAMAGGGELGSDIGATVGLIQGASQSATVQAAASVMIASVAFWETQQGSVAPIGRGGGGPQAVNWDYVGKALSDVMATAVYLSMFPLLQVPAYVVAGLASIAFHVTTTTDWGDGYQVPPWADPML